MLVSAQPTQITTSWEDYSTQRNGQWKPVPEESDDEADFFPDFDAVSKEDPTDPQSRQLSAQETEQVLMIGANRVRVTAPKVTAYYRRPNPLHDFWAHPGSEQIVEAMQKVATGALLLVVPVLFLNSSNVLKSNLQIGNQLTSRAENARVAAVHRVTRTAITASAARPLRFSQSSGKSFMQTPKSTFPQMAIVPVVHVQPLAEYKGPLSLTGVTMPHRHAYQTAAIEVHPVQ